MKANLGTIEVDTTSVIDRTHPAVVVTMKAKADNGTLKKGLLVAKDAQDEMVAYDPVSEGSEKNLKGVLITTIDTDAAGAADDAAPVLKHGTVVRDALLVGENPPSAEDLAALEAIGIFAL